MRPLEVQLELLFHSQRRVTSLLMRGYRAQDWREREGEWSFREVAAHMRQVEIEAWYARIQRILTEETPQFDYYYTTGWLFDNCDLHESLSDWFKWRQRVFGIVRGLSADQHTRTGLHTTFGEVTPRDILTLMHDHDRGHLADLERMVKLFELQK